MTSMMDSGSLLRTPTEEDMLNQISTLSSLMLSLYSKLSSRSIGMLLLKSHSSIDQFYASTTGFQLLESSSVRISAPEYQPPGRSLNLSRFYR